MTASTEDTDTGPQGVSQQQRNKPVSPCIRYGVKKAKLRQEIHVEPTLLLVSFTLLLDSYLLKHKSSLEVKIWK